MTSEDLPALDPKLGLYISAILGRKARDLVVLDLRPLSSLADVFIICSGTSNRQVSAMAEHVRVELKKHDIRPLSAEGQKQGHWVLLDYGHVVIHIFYETVRAFYDLEGLWADAQRLDYQHLADQVDL